MRRLPLALFLVLLALQPLHAARRRLVFPPPAAPQPQSGTPAEWLASHALTLTTVEPSADRSDIAAAGALVGDAHVVGLGDATHGTHEFYAVKLRLIDYLVREKNFDVVAFEGAFPVFERLNVYVQGGSGDARAILGEAAAQLDYHFWDVEEILTLVEWMRDFNLHRGARAAIEIAGADVFDPLTASANVVAYLRGVDPSAAGSAEHEYSCVSTSNLFDQNCRAAAVRVLDALTAKHDQYAAVSGARDFDTATQNASVTVQTFDGLGGAKRDANMARNTLWLRDHRGSSGRIIIWGHQEHVARVARGWTGGATLGAVLNDALGSDYFVFGTLGRSGTFGSWIVQSGSGTEEVFTPASLPAAEPESYEAIFSQRGVSYLVVPLRGSVPAWLAGPHTIRRADWIGAVDAVSRSLPQMMDAAIYVESTTPVHPLQH
jgi:erythromycin esterase